MEVDVTQIGEPKKFEKMCTDLLYRTYPDIKPIEGAGGDDGIDSFAGYLNGCLVVFQYKYLPGRLDSSRKKQILDSLNTAITKNPGLKEWTLIIPTVFTIDEQKWFEVEVIQKNNIKIDYWGKQKIEAEISKNQTLLERYFSSSLMNAAKKLIKQCLFLQIRH
jgi:hypothetical protein